MNEKSLAASVAAHTSWANTTDRAARTAKARAALQAKFEREVDPEGTMPPAERAKRAEHLRKAYYARLALKSVQARRAAKQASGYAAAAEARLRELGGAA